MPPTKNYNGGAVTLIPGNNTVRVNIAASADGTAGTTANGQYRISRATVVNNVVGAYASVGWTPAVRIAGTLNGSYTAAFYDDNNTVNGTTYSYTVALDNNA
jgi:hypothetical protein